MGIKPLFTKEDVSRRLSLATGRIDAAIAFNMKYLGRECVKNAREMGDYVNQTGNLRNSVGFMLLRDGKVLNRDFKRSATVTNTSKGAKEGVLAGQALAERIAESYPSGYVLIVVAGMEYAVHVESKGKNVLTSAEQYANVEMPFLLSKLRGKIKNMKA